MSEILQRLIDQGVLTEEQQAQVDSLTSPAINYRFHSLMNDGSVELMDDASHSVVYVERDGEVRVI